VVLDGPAVELTLHGRFIKKLSEFHWVNPPSVTDPRVITSFLLTEVIIQCFSSGNFLKLQTPECAKDKFLTIVLIKYFLS